MGLDQQVFLRGVNINNLWYRLFPNFINIPEGVFYENPGNVFFSFRYYSFLEDKDQDDEMAITSY